MPKKFNQYLMKIESQFGFIQGLKLGHERSGLVHNIGKYINFLSFYLNLYESSEY